MVTVTVMVTVIVTVTVKITVTATVTVSETVTVTVKNNNRNSNSAMIWKSFYMTRQNKNTTYTDLCNLYQVHILFKMKCKMLTILLI